MKEVAAVALRAARRHGFLLAVAGLGIAAVLVFAGLDNRYLWDDEAENALLARSILRTGLPIARDGIHVISQGCGWDADENYLWTFHAWGPMYLAAGAFALLGESTWAARLPFALLGFLAIPSLYVVGRRWFADRATAVLACTFLALSVPWLLHVRQSRYYALAGFAGVWILDGFLGTVHGRRGAVVTLVAASTLMLHANHAMLASTYLALVVAFALLEFDARAIGRLAAAAAATVALNAVWLVVYGGGFTVGLSGAPSGPAAWRATIAAAVATFLSYLRRLDFVTLPALVVVLFGVWLVLEGRAAVWRSEGFRRVLFLLVFVLTYLAGLSVLPTVFFRYVVHLLPALALVLAWMVRTLGARRPVLAALVTVVVLVSDAGHGWLSGVAHRRDAGQAAIRWPLVSYLHEITHEFTGPIKALVRHLEAHARPGETLYISYGDLPLRFYTTLDVRGGQACESPVVVPPPDWVVVRPFFRTANMAPGSMEDVARHVAYVRTEIPWRRYERITLPAFDTVWESIPEPQWHQFRTPTAGTPVVIYHRVAASPARP